MILSMMVSNGFKGRFRFKGLSLKHIFLWRFWVMIFLHLVLDKCCCSCMMGSFSFHCCFVLYLWYYCSCGLDPFKYVCFCSKKYNPWLLGFFDNEFYDFKFLMVGDLTLAYVLLRSSFNLRWLFLTYNVLIFICLSFSFFFVANHVFTLWVDQQFVLKWLQALNPDCYSKSAMPKFRIGCLAVSLDS